MISRSLLARLLGIALGAIFLYASVSKVIDPAAFSRTVYHYQLLPPAAVNLVAIVLPWIEALVGALLIFGLRVRGASLLAVITLILFLGAMSSALARGLNIDCGCFKAEGTKLGLDRIIGDLVLLAAAFFVYRESARVPQPGREASGFMPSSVKESS